MKISFKFLREWFLPWRAYVSEFLGTLVFVFITLSISIVDSLYGDVGKLAISMAIGFSYISLVYATIHLSGGFLNPAITISLWLAQKISGIRAFFFIVSQLVASVAAAGLVILIFGKSAFEFGLGLSEIGLGVSMETAICVEAIITACLVFVVFSTIVSRNGPVSFGPLALGAFVLGASILFLPVTGAVFNPARAVGPALISKNYSLLLIYVLGPLVGSLFGLFCEFVFIKPPRKK